MPDVLGIVFAVDPRRPWLAARSARSLRRAGVRDVGTLAVDGRVPPGDGRPLLLLRAGAWLRSPEAFAPPPISATGRLVVAVGLPAAGPVTDRWRALRERTGGDFSAAATDAGLPPVACAWVSAGAEQASVIAALLDQPDQGVSAGADAADSLYAGLAVSGATAAQRPALHAPLARAMPPCRVVHWPLLDVYADDGPRVLQVVTSLQHGGAEQVTWDLHDLLPSVGVASCLATLGRPLRQSLPDPADRVDLAGAPAAERMDAAADVAVRFGADLVHAHLIRGGDADRLARCGVPLVVTVHNTRAGWPEGLDRLRPGSGALLVACARAVERELVAAGVPAATRTAWNGINVGAFEQAATPRGTGPTLTLVCVANPRPQKRLHLLPAVLAAVRDELARRGGPPCGARLVIAGEAASAEAAACVAEVRRAAVALGVADRVEWTVGRRAVRDVLAAADVLVSLSAHEGLSLAHLEALAAGLPVVATDVGGTAEIAHGNPRLTLVAPDAPAVDVARAVLAAARPHAWNDEVRMTNDEAERERHSLTPLRHSPSPVRRDFSRERMAARYAWLYRAALGPPRGDVLWFVANNLSTGGAQSSLRRLAKALHAGGVPVRVALLQEYPEHPTPGRLDLLAAGVPVTVLPPAGLVDAAEAVGLLLGELSAAPPRAVCFWNAIQSYKLLLADALLRVPVFDASPGEMFFASLDQYFQSPRPALPYRGPRDYGERLAGVVVKYAAEARLAADQLGTAVHVIPNGVTLPPLPSTPRPATGGRAGCGAGLVIGTATRLHPHKRVEDLVDAFRLALPRLPAASVLRVAGRADTGCEDYAAALRARSIDLPVEWLGEVSGVAGFHAGLDLFAMISEPAGCPNASLEAMAAGLPVVATNVGGAGEQVADGATGRVVPPRDATALADALVELGRCADCRRRMGEASRRRVVERFSLERMVAAYRSVLYGE